MQEYKWVETAWSKHENTNQSTLGLKFGVPSQTRFEGSRGTQNSQKGISDHVWNAIGWKCWECLWDSPSWAALNAHWDFSTCQNMD